MQEREEQFQHKQRVLQEATAKATAQAALRKRNALSAFLTAWRHISRVYKVLAERLATLQRLSLAGTVQHWRSYTYSRVRSLKTDVRFADLLTTSEDTAHSGAPQGASKGS